MGSETYEYLKKLVDGSGDRWPFPDDSLLYNVGVGGKNAEVTIRFDDSDDYLKIFGIDEKNDDRYIYNNYFHYNYYDSGDYDDYQYREDWKEGYIIQGFNTTNRQLLDEIITIINPTIANDDSLIAKYLYDTFEGDIEDIIGEYGSENERCRRQGVRDTISKELSNPFLNFGIIELVPHYKFQTTVFILLKLFKIFNAEDDDIMGLLKKIYEKFPSNQVGDWNELEYNVWCDDYDANHIQERITVSLESILDEIKENIDDTSLGTYNELYNAVKKLGGFNLLIKIPGKNYEVIFEGLDVHTNRLVFKLYKPNNQMERRSVDNLDDLNLTLYHPELFESVKKIIKEETSGKHRLIRLIKNYGIENGSKAVGGIDNLLMVLNVKTPMDFLHLFDDLEQVQSEEELDWTLFRYKPNQNLMIYDRKNGDVYISYDEIWSVLEDNFGLKYSEIQQLTERWLDEVYNLRGVTPIINFCVNEKVLDEVYNLRK